ncbi:MAG: hypothetical protein IIA64_12180 [Planctomycetes bacterium]|nr:hypothetical protein [Planctomycetota bacterium]
MTAMYLRAVVGAVALLLGSTVCSQDADPPSAAIVDQDEALMRMLQETLIDADYDRIDFERVIDDLRERFDLNIHVSWSQLAEIGVRRDQRIEVKLKQIPLATLLDIVLREVGDPDVSLNFIVSDGILRITSSDLTREPTVLRTYDVTDLIESGYAIRRFANTPVLGLELTGREFIGGELRREASGGGGEGSGGGGSIFGDPSDDFDDRSEMERIQQIIDLLMMSVEPDTWVDYGGETGSIQAFESTLLIRHTLRGHQKIAELFQLLRSSQPQTLDADVAVVRLRTDRAAELRLKIGKRFPRLTAEQAAELAWSPQSEGVLFRGIASGFNGSRLWFSALTQRDVLSGMTATVGEGVNAFAPRTATSTAGIELIVLPLLSPESDQVTIDVQMAWVPSTEISSRDVALGTPSGNGSIDQTKRSMRTVSAATTVKLGDAIAFSIPAQLSDTGSAVEFEDWLIVRVRRPGS